MTTPKPEPTVWRYVLRNETREGWGEGWAVFLFDSTGYFSVISDFGSYTHYWSGYGGGDFRAFLTRLDEEYVLRKLAPNKVFSGEETLKGILERIIENRRDGTFTKEEAREEWDLAKDDSSFDEIAFANWYRNTRISDAWEMGCYVHDGQARGFCRRVWPRFIQLLKDDLAQEAARVLTESAEVGKVAP